MAAVTPQWRLQLSYSQTKVLKQKVRCQRLIKSVGTCQEFRVLVIAVQLAGDHLLVQVDFMHLAPSCCVLLNVSTLPNKGSSGDMKAGSGEFHRPSTPPGEGQEFVGGAVGHLPSWSIPALLEGA